VHAAHLPVGDLQDAEAIPRLHRANNLPHIRARHKIAPGGQQVVQAVEAHIAAISRQQRDLLHQGGEVLPGGQPLQHGLRFRLAGDDYPAQAVGVFLLQRFDHVEARRRLNRADDLAHLRREHRLLELSLRLAALDKAQVAAVPARALVQRALAGQRVEVRAVPQLVQDGLGLGFSLDQDVPHLDSARVNLHLRANDLRQRLLLAVDGQLEAQVGLADGGVRGKPRQVVAAGGLETGRQPAVAGRRQPQEVQPQVVVQGGVGPQTAILVFPVHDPLANHHRQDGPGELLRPGQCVEHADHGGRHGACRIGD